MAAATEVTWQVHSLYDETLTPEGGVLQMGFKVVAPNKRQAHVTARIHFHILLRGMGFVWYDPQGKHEEEGS